MKQKTNTREKLTKLKSQFYEKINTSEKPLDKLTKKCVIPGFPGGAVVKNPPANSGDMGSSPGLGRSHMLWSS